MAFPVKPPISGSPILGGPSAAPLAPKPSPSPFPAAKPKLKPATPPMGLSEPDETPEAEAKSHPPAFLKKAAKLGGRKFGRSKTGRSFGR